MNEQIQELLQGAIDLHVHCDPSFMKRTGDAITFSNDAAANGMRAICLKDHHWGTAQAAFLANAHMSKSSTPFDCFASLCLNHSEGDFNLYILEMNLRFGVKQVYMPTISDRTPIRPLKNASKNDNPGAFLPIKFIPPKEKPLHVLNTNGDVKAAVLDCIALIRDYGAILSTGHLDYEEAYKVVKAAVAMGCKKILLTHFNAPELLYDQNDRKRTLQEMREIQALGDCYVEYTHTMITNGASSLEDQLAAIDFFGPDRVCLGSDCGSINYPDLIGCWDEMLTNLVTHNYTKADIHKMCRENQMRLLELND